MIYTNKDNVQIPVEITGVKNSSWIYCKYVNNGIIECIHRKYIVADKGNAEIEKAMNAVTDGLNG